MPEHHHHHHDDVPPIVKEERRRGTALTLIALGILVLIALFFLIGDMFVEAVPEAEADANVVVKTGNRS